MLVQQFEEQVRKNPDRLAIKTEEHSVTYTQLNQKANQLASAILQLAQKVELSSDQVALLFEQGVDMITATLGSLKAGKIYIPCDSSYPENRLLSMLEDSEAQLVVTNNRNLEVAQRLVHSTDAEIWILNLDQLAQTDVTLDWAAQRRDDDIAYLLYTSGSTGQPKGIIQSQTNVAYFIENYTNKLSITAEDRLTLFSTFGHDAAVMDIYGGLLNGATLYPVNIKENLNPERLVNWLREEKITIWHSVPTLYRRFARTLQGEEDLQDLRWIVLGGEGIREHDVTLYQKHFPKATLVNLYGQSESSFNSAQLIQADQPFEKIILGEPLARTRMLLIDEKGKKVAPLRIGEIVIASEHVALGYWKNEEKTKQVFTSHPKLGKLYWTGDQGRLQLDGSIEFVGRKDFQLKIRGFRIEPGEIESQLLKHPGIKEAVVMGRKDTDGELCLCTYYVASEPLLIPEIREFLAKELPDHMIPSYYLTMKNLPMTATGKVDRGALPGLEEFIQSKVAYVPPQNPTEEQLVRIWQEVLKVDEIGIDDHFFSLGGHSLKATTLVSRIYQTFDVELSLRVIFNYPTIRLLAEQIGGAEKSIYTSLQPIEEQESYQVSSAQRRMFILNQLEGVSITYNMPKALLVEGALDRQQLEETFEQLIQRHETLRTTFKLVDGEVLQFVHAEPKFAISYYETEESKLPETIQEFVQPFDLNRAPLLRVGLVKLSGTTDQHLLLFDMHHIISDGLSMSILVQEFVQLYAGKQISQLPIQYKDFAAWQNQLMATGGIKDQEAYWVETFTGEIPVLNLPTDYPRPAVQSFAGDLVEFEIGPDLTQKLQTLAQKTGTTLYMVLLAAYNLLLAKYTGQEDLVVGSPIAGRAHPDLTNLIGIFVNFLAMRNQPEGEKRFTDFLAEIKANSLKAYENQDYQFEQLVERLEVKRQLDRNPLFDTMFILQNIETNATGIEGLQFTPYENPQTVAKLDLTLNAMEVGAKIQCEFEYGTKLFKEETIRRLARHFLHLLEKITTDPEQKLMEINLLPEDEKELILQQFIGPKVDYPREQTIQQLFEEQARLHPEKTALVFEEESLTYSELNRQANQLARHLRQRGVQADSVVAVVTKRSLEMLVGIMAVLKAGGAYLPIDPDYPIERIRYILEDSNAQILLTQKKLTLEGGLVVDCETLCLDDQGLYQGEARDLDLVNTGQNLAYLIYTSGSTGKPKGVMVEHQAVHNFIQGMTREIHFTPEKSILALTTISFDIFGLETLLPLTQGLQVVIGNDEHQKDPKALAMVIRKHQIQMLQMTPSRMRMLLNDQESAACLTGVQEIMLGGETLPEDLLAEVKAITSAKIYNLYGPTEATIWATVKELTGTDQVTIGRPIANTAVYILSATGEMQPPGIPGELCISGEGLARGYQNRPDLTDEAFVPNPFALSEDLTPHGARLYRTGDLAKWLPDGEIAFIGRTDDQVKIRGFRIELGEIENQLLQHSKVTEAVVVAKKDPNGGQYLCAYLVGEEEVELPELKAHLSKELPDYMVPTYFIPMEELPYTPNGKIDRKALPEPDAGMVSGVEYVAPSSEIEEKLVQIWQEVLGIDGIGVDHNFFDIGGNSINIVKVISLISQRMGVEVPMSELFLRPTVAEIANNMFINRPLEGLECVIRLNKPTEGKKNVFILHTWEGIIYQYKELAKLLEGEYNLYGIQAKGVLKPAPLPETLEEMITDYIVEIKSIQPEGPYIIAGYCYGNWIAYKMVQMLEDQGVPIDRMIQIDENAFLPDRIRKFVRAKTIATGPQRFSKKWTRKLITHRDQNPMDYWPNLEDYKQSKPQIEGEIQNERTVRENVNHLCTVGYSLEHLVSVDTYIIKAEENNLVRYTPEDWQKQTNGKVWFTEIPGGHESIFNYPYVEGLAKAFKRTLEE